MSFSVDQIDHVELIVSDRRVAASWYRDVLGLEVLVEYEHWADDPRGPLMIGTREGGTKLALFEGLPGGSQKGTGFHLVAFRVSAQGFADFVSRLARLALVDDRGRTVTSEMIADHGSAFSIYFCDPYGNQLEITTYEYEAVKKTLSRI